MKHSFDFNRKMADALSIYQQRLLDADQIYTKYKDFFLGRKCPACNFEKSIPQDDFRDSYKISRCSRCSTFYVNPAPNLQALDDYYNSCSCNKMLANITRNRKFNVDDRVKAVLELLPNIHKKNLKVLEVGCSSGTFLSGLKSTINALDSGKSFEFFGLDLDDYAIKNCVDSELDLRCISVENFVRGYSYESGKFDIILHFELIEHLFDPINFMKSLSLLLEDDGFMIFTTPNFSGLENIASSYNTRRLIAHAIFPPMHLNAYSVKNIGILSYIADLGIEQIFTPGRLDVDMSIKNIDFIDNPVVKNLISEVSDCNDSQLASIQDLISISGGSSHMQVILRKL